MIENAQGRQPTIVMVGGFLGAGKTTLLLAAAQELRKAEMRCAIILNDQGDALVDSELADIHGAMHGEVTGGCFCCRFSDLAKVLDDLRAFSPDVIFAEPVGSCTDISATTLQPLLAYTEYELAPFTVLVDPARARELSHKDADVNLRYLFTKQIEEADILCFTKSDLYPDYPDVPALTNDRQVRQLSAASGQGVAAWLDEVLSGRISCGSRILCIDYQQYAQAEAALVWLNLRADFRTEPAVPPALLLGPYFDRLDEELTATGCNIVHMKAIMQCKTGFVKAAISRNGQQPRVEGNLAASPASHHRLLLNLRVLGTADAVRVIVEDDLHRIEAEISHVQISCFHPAAPNPEHRFSRPVELESEHSTN